MLARRKDGLFDPAVEVLMTPRPITTRPSDTVAQAASVMRTCHVRHLPVVGPELVGVLSLRDVVAADDDARVSEVMSAPAETIAAGTPLALACERMLGAHRSCLPVVDGGKLAGIFTATDALRFAQDALEEEGRALRRAPAVAQLMTPRPLVTADETMTLEAAWRLMRTNHVRHLPVVGDGEVVGLLSDRDVLAAGREALRPQTLTPPLVVADAMSTRLSTITVEEPASQAAATLLRRRVGALPVLRGQELLGIVTVSDFLYWILARA